MTNDEKNVRVRRFKCKCGKARMLSVIQPGKKHTKAILKQHSELLEAGLSSDVISLKKARECEMCFTCEL